MWKQKTIIKTFSEQLIFWKNNPIQVKLAEWKRTANTRKIGQTLKCYSSFSGCDNGQLKHHKQKKHHLDKMGMNIIHNHLGWSAPHQEPAGLEFLSWHSHARPRHRHCPKGCSTPTCHILFPAQSQSWGPVLRTWVRSKTQQSSAGS